MQKILFLHHSTGNCIWLGDTSSLTYKFTRKGTVQRIFDEYNKQSGAGYMISDMIFPKKAPYGWKNYPYDYYNIWVKNAGPVNYLEEPTLEILTREYDVIIMKHCFPVAKILEENGPADIDSEVKTLGNYKLQYEALKKKMHSFPYTKFIVWTPPAIVRSQITPEQALRLSSFHKWITGEWNEEGDNIYIWDFYSYETEGELYLKDENAYSVLDSHPGKKFSEKMANVFSTFIIDVIENRITDKKITIKDGRQKSVPAYSAGDTEKVS
jgi:hypothetical protein